MTDNQKRLVIKLRSEGLSYKEISNTVGLSEGTVKSFCSRAKDKEKSEDPRFCVTCGKPIESIPHHRAKRFCSRECGLKWWHEHPEKLNRKSLYSFVCLSCGKEFSSYGNKGRKYCSHQCYINSRFKGISHAAE